LPVFAEHPATLYESEAPLKDDSPMDEESFAFGSFRLIPGQRLLLEDDKPLRIGSRALDILITLVESVGGTVGKEQLIARTWPDTVVDDGALRVHVAALRKALGDGRGGMRYIVNVPGRGYGFVAPVVREPRHPETEQRQPETTSLGQAAAGGNLPVPLTRILGRDDVIAALVTQLSQHRFLTIVGPGGVGKTTVAIAVAQAASAFYKDGLWFVALSSLADPTLVPSAVTATLGIAQSGVNPVSGLTGWLRDKHALIVLDSCEHVISAAAKIVEEILRAARNVSILVTSREPLRAEGERIHRLGTLRVPPDSVELTLEDILRYPAVELFTERAAAIVEQLSFDCGELAAVVEICRRLDGMPLALELAAAQVNVFGVRGLAGRLDDRFTILTKGRRTALPRHQTLRAAIDWSYYLLLETEQRILAGIAVFQGDFTMDAAAAVVAGDRIQPTDVFEGLANLAMKSLVRTDISGKLAHHRLLDTTRAYALEKLIESGEVERVKRLHAEYYRDLFEQAEAEWVTRPTAEWLADYKRQIDDLRAALDWAFAPGGDASVGVALAVAAVPLWMQLSLLDECRSRAQRALAVLSAGERRDLRREMKLYAALATSLIYTRGQTPTTVEAWSDALAAAEKLDDTEHRLQGLYGLWNCRASSGQVAAAMDVARQFRRLAVERSDATDVLIADRMIGSLLHTSGEQAAARHHLETMVNRYVPPVHRTATMRHQFDQRIVAQAMLALSCWVQGFPDQATALAATALERALATDHENAVCYALVEGACPVALLTGDLALAKRLVSQLLDRSSRYGLTTWQVQGLILEGELLIRCGDTAIGLSRLRTALEEVSERRLLVRLPGLLGVLAEGCVLAGSASEAATLIEQALAASERSGVRWCYPELLRIKGQVAQLDGDRMRAEAAFSHALELGRHQGSLSWQLRAASSLARLWAREGRSREARELVRPIYLAFTEGFQTRDLLEAKALMGSDRRDGA
jgi:predicted ATPase/DNA-binding winged helix-turn-helix (wHTH) protein